MVKLINNAVAAANTAVVAEALLLGKRSGVDLDKLVTVMKAGSGGSVMLELKEGPMRDHDYTTLFKLEHMLKDLRLCLDEAEAAAPEMSFAGRPPRSWRKLTTRTRRGRLRGASLEALEERSGTQALAR